MLEGTYISPEILRESVVIMAYMIGEVDVCVKDRMVGIMIILQYYIQYWKSCREKTSSSVTGLNFGLWKAIESSNKVTELHAMMKHMAFQLGNPLTRWCKGLHTILQNIDRNIKM